MNVSCKLSHVGGHSISSSFPIPVESKAGASKQQHYASASTYARRYSLIQVLGLTTTEHDNDGNEAKAPENTETISEDEVHSLNDELIEVEADVVAFYSAFGVVKLSELTPEQLKQARKMIDVKRQARK